MASRQAGKSISRLAYFAYSYGKVEDPALMVPGARGRSAALRKTGEI